MYPLVAAVALVLAETPPLYTVTIALVAGDALGNFHVFIPVWIAIVFAAIAAALFLATRPAAATTIALIAIAAVATVPVHRLLEPPPGRASLTHFADDSPITLEGRLVRAPEQGEGGRAYLYVRAERAGAIATTPRARLGGCAGNGTGPATFQNRR